MSNEAPSIRLANPPAELCDRLRLAVERAAVKNAESMEGLRAAVADFTIALREQGTTPEAVLISLKNVIHNRSLPLILPHPSDRNSASLRETISTWCIEEFFRDARYQTVQS